MVDVRREVAKATRPELGNVYSGCVDQFERGMSRERLKEVFDELKTELVPLLRAIQKKVCACAPECTPAHPLECCWPNVCACMRAFVLDEDKGGFPAREGCLFFLRTQHVSGRNGTERNGMERSKGI